MIESNVRTLLNSATGVTNLIGANNVEPIVNDSDPPCITYSVITATRNPVLAGVESTLRNVRMQIDCWGQTYQQSKNLAEAVYSALVTATGLQCVLNLEQDAFDIQTKSHRVVLDFSIWQNS